MELNREVLDCMKTLRRRLRAEQALDIRLSQADAISAMLSACLASTDEQTRQLGRRLAQYSERPFDNAPAADAALRIYRGQRVQP